MDGDLHSADGFDKSGKCGRRGGGRAVDRYFNPRFATRTLFGFVFNPRRPINHWSQWGGSRLSIERLGLGGRGETDEEVATRLSVTTNHNTVCNRCLVVVVVDDDVVQGVDNRFPTPTRRLFPPPLGSRLNKHADNDRYSLILINIHRSNSH